MNPLKQKNKNAILIGVNSYQTGTPSLITPINDAYSLSELLEKKYGYNTQVFQNIQKQSFDLLLDEISKIPCEEEKEFVIFYFAGHGVAHDDDKGRLEGFLIPSDAIPSNSDTFISMRKLYQSLKKRNPHHLLIILDCCFSGAFRWSSGTRGFIRETEVTKEQYNYFLQNKSWQVITSSSYDEKALDILSGNLARESGTLGKHSPFAQALIDGLKGNADLIPKNGNGIITANELIMYLQSEFNNIISPERHLQMPGLWTLDLEHKGQFIFTSESPRISSAPPLVKENNPYRGLKSFEEDHKELFFGRDKEVKTLLDKIVKNNFVVVTGASGSGKSSLVKAGIVSEIRNYPNWEILPTIRPGETPFIVFFNLFSINQKQRDLSLFEKVNNYCSQSNKEKILLVIDQFEEIFTLSKNSKKRDKFINEISGLISRIPQKLHLVVTLRSDFEPQFSNTELQPFWRDARYVISKLTQDELRKVILGPAEMKSIFFEPESLIDSILNEVLDSPGSLPLLSFALSELYFTCIEKPIKTRTITEDDYLEFNGVIGALQSRADNVFDSLADDLEKKIMKNLFIRMVSFEAGDIAKRRVMESELEFGEHNLNLKAKKVISILQSSRLVVADKDGENQPFYEPAHEQLVRGWSKLQQWIEEFDQENILLLRSISRAAQEWEKGGRKNGLLWVRNPKLVESKRLGKIKR